MSCPVFSFHVDSVCEYIPPLMSFRKGQMLLSFGISIVVVFSYLRRRGPSTRVRCGDPTRIIVS